VGVVGGSSAAIPDRSARASITQASRPNGPTGAGHWSWTRDVPAGRYETLAWCGATIVSSGSTVPSGRVCMCCGVTATSTASGDSADRLTVIAAAAEA
jgi:hypothetical protein